MSEKSFELTSKDLIKLSIMILLATFLFGFPGLIMMLFMQWATRQTYAIDSAQKHGISHAGASRLGGTVIFGFSLTGYAVIYLSDLAASDNFLSIPHVAWITVLTCMIIGLTDDLKSNFLSPVFRLFSLILVFGLCVFFLPYLVPLKLGVPGLDFLLTIQPLGLLLTVIFCVGFVNAVNMADGANGLMPGTLTLAFLLFYWETGMVVYASLMTACAVFTIFNVISGRLFLGDAGAYGLGSVLVLSGLYLFSEKVFSASFLAVLLAYPCIDILVTVFRRKLKGRSVFLPDNDHLHNRIHFQFQDRFSSRTLSNSMTGMVIVTFSSGIALFGFAQQWWPASGHQWAWVFLLQCILYGVTFLWAGLNRPTSQFVVG